MNRFICRLLLTLGVISISQNTLAAIPSITPASQNISGYVGEPITSATYTASDFSFTVSYSSDCIQSRSIGSWLSLDPATGVFTGTPTSTVASYSCTVTASSADGVATSSVLISVSNRPNPTNSSSVESLAQASIASAKSNTHNSVRNVEMRMDWLRRHRNKLNNSLQDLKIAFADPLLNQFVNGDPRALDAFKLASASDALQQYGQNPNQIMSDVQSIPMEIAMAEAQEKFGKVDLNPTGGKVVGDWYLWTAGQITLGNHKDSTSTVNNNSEAINLAIGMDKSDADSMFGFAVNGSSENTDIGADGSKQKAEGLSLSIYGGFDSESLPPIELILGVGKMEIRSTRIDGSQTLTGMRTAGTLFGSVGILAEAIKRGRVTITPYSKIEAAYIELGAYEESGGSLALAYDKQIVKQTMLRLGVDADYDTHWLNGKFTPFTRLEYAYDFSPSSDADMHYVGDSTNYRLTTDKSAVSNFTLRLGGDYAHNSGAETSVFYERTESINSGYSDSVQLKVSIPF